MNLTRDQATTTLSTRISPRFAPSQLRKLDSWQVRQHLGSGTFSDVWLLEHRKSFRRIACKTPKDPQQGDSLLRELGLAQELRHQNIIRCLDHTSDRSLPDIPPKQATFWEFLPGGSLEELIAVRGALTLQETVTVVTSLIQIVQYLQSLAIVHGDISPSNIMFDLTGRPVLIDFGSSRTVGMVSVRTGTQGFIAPEILDPSDQAEGLGAACDVYSIAAVAWFCLTGMVPEPSVVRLPLSMIVSGLDSEIIEILEACLSPEPGLRPALDRVAASVSNWEVAAPIDLFPSVGDEYGLLLPTRDPEESKRSSVRRRLGHWYARRKTVGEKRPWLIRLVALLCAAVLLVGFILTKFYVQTAQFTEPKIVQDTATDHISPDFQAVLDQLARSRSVAWSTGNPDLVQNYAVDGSKVYQDDVAALEKMQDAQHTLDGIRMRTVVDSTRVDAGKVLVKGTWRIDSYVQRDATGQEIQKVASRTDQVVIELVETDDGWRMSEVR